VDTSPHQPNSRRKPQWTLGDEAKMYERRWPSWTLGNMFWWMTYLAIVLAALSYWHPAFVIGGVLLWNTLVRIAGRHQRARAR